MTELYVFGNVSVAFFSRDVIGSAGILLSEHATASREPDGTTRLLPRLSARIFDVHIHDDAKACAASLQSVLLTIGEAVQIKVRMHRYVHVVAAVKCTSGVRVVVA